ncbi:class I SAM-dependent methyltransferase [Halobacillus sp. KCTC 3957]|uniref:Uncharacterized methyltransferase H0267_12970 n=1 Tax=Halobacillus yeomjeoni TaxID=311194 RepID=A0A931MVY2_9BACI|nr:class I SAM-dependent methyltransferase [Halobacillus yeomjeoni]MBH0231132.1 class I SAM-dependent methyltransferase [Halobacillus yeomjeoni]
MGIEFVDLFDQWASTYDETVAGNDPEYREVFSGYDEILGKLAGLAQSPVMEFGVGTANLTRKIIQHNKVVFGIEPSREMRKIAKIKCPEAGIYEGDFLNYPTLVAPIRSIVSSFAFHHLNSEEKKEAIRNYKELLEPEGEVIFIDTLFKDESYKHTLIKNAEEQGYSKLAQDLQEEYYPYLEDLKEMFVKEGFEVSFQQLNKYAWLIRAKKGE